MLIDLVRGEAAKEDYDYASEQAGAGADEAAIVRQRVRRGLDPLAAGQVARKAAEASPPVAFRVWRGLLGKTLQVVSLVLMMIGCGLIISDFPGHALERSMVVIGFLFGRVGARIQLRNRTRLLSTVVPHTKSARLSAGKGLFFGTVIGAFCGVVYGAIVGGVAGAVGGLLFGTIPGALAGFGISLAGKPSALA